MSLQALVAGALTRSQQRVVGMRNYASGLSWGVGHTSRKADGFMTGRALLYSYLYRHNVYQCSICVYVYEYGAKYAFIIHISLMAIS